MAIQPGAKAPAVVLKRKTAEGMIDVNMSAKAGSRSTVLLFFPLAFSSVCQKEMCGVSEGLKEYEALEADVYGISVDSPLALEAFAKANAISVPLLSDFNREAVDAYDVRDDDFAGLRGVAKRSAFVINPEGMVIYSWSSDDPRQLPDFAEIRQVLKG